MVDQGDQAPAFELTGDDGSTVRLSDVEGPVVLYFYPRAFTPGCTTQACDFRDRHETFQEAGYTVFGVSPDDPDELARFRDEYELPFRLLSDPDHRVAEEYGAWGEKKNYGKTYEGLIRSTFVLDGDHRLASVQRNVRAKGHVDRLTEALT